MFNDEKNQHVNPVWPTPMFIDIYSFFIFTVLIVFPYFPIRPPIHRRREEDKKPKELSGQFNGRVKVRARPY
jgi:hypothetical protein